ncbi:hypothetical protein CMO95_03410 [Candidatus Woesearchaeota archaeon]|jgi:ribosomal protein S3AE|nr:hypothetical protein [Candidatus Woesearchaeota archaeon]MBN88612.1 hypothetical protein [Candidatus Woesearchaeota archaeon]|tara:strand:- start:120 stop:695 length:576 start_codon:yes stop_codon:yes gene_type:complete
MVKKQTTKLKLRKGKKRWFPVMSPKIYGEKEITKITSYDPESLVNRQIKLTLKALTNSGRDSNVSIKLKINKVKGDTAYTENIGIETSDSQIYRFSRRKSTRILNIFNVSDKNDNKIKLKTVILANENITRAKQNELRVYAESLIKKKISKSDYTEIFTSDFIKKISIGIKKELKPIYPVNDAIIWKANLQ